MHNKQEKLFYPVIKAYFENNQSIRKIAKNFNLHYQTVFKWIKHFKKFKNPPLFKPWNRSPEKIETLVIKYKERYPWLTIKQAQKLLLEKNIKISCYGIWNIWKRNGYSGFDKKEFSNDFTDFIILTKEAKVKLMQAEYLFSIGKITEAARILNSISWLPKNDLVLKIPEELLNLRRRIEKLSIDFGKVSLAEYIKKAKIIFQRCIKNQWYYSALRTGVALLYALSWLGDVREQKRLIKKIEKLLPNKKRRPKDLMPIYLTLLLAKIHTFIQMLKITDAMRLARYCYHLLLQHKKPLYDFLYDLAVQFIYLEDYNTAKKLLHKAMVGIDEQKKKKLMVMLAVYVYLLRCDKKKRIKNFE